MTTPAPTPRTWSDLDPYLKAIHLKGQTIPATIDHIEFQTVHPRPGQEEIKPVMYFAGKIKGLILTSTNQDYLRKTYGDEIGACYGKAVRLKPVTKKVAGREVETILIESTAQAPAPQGRNVEKMGL